MVDPKDSEFAARAALAAAGQADALLKDDDAWKWTDIHYLPPLPGQVERRVSTVVDFKTELALPVYGLAILVWVTAISSHSKYAGRDVRGDYKERLLRHAAAIETRAGWQHGDAASTIEEEIKNRIYCYGSPANKYATKSGICEFQVDAHNDIERTREKIADVKLSYYAPEALCTYSPNQFAAFVREAWDKDQALILCGKLVEGLRSLAYSAQFPAPPFIPPLFGEVAQTVLIYAITEDGRLFEHVFELPAGGAPRASAQVGVGWTDGTAVPGGRYAMYWVQENGIIKLYYHTGADKMPPTASWTDGGGITIGERGQDPGGFWAPSNKRLDFVRNRMIFGGGYGKLYAVDQTRIPGGGKPPFQKWAITGDLSVISHSAFENGKGEGAFTDEFVIKKAWGREFKHVFSTGGEYLYGVIARVAQKGQLYWHHRQGFGPFELVVGPVRVGERVDWSVYTRIFGAENGWIFGVRGDGSMECFKHRGFKVGGAAVSGPIKLAGNWSNLRGVFAALPPFNPTGLN